MSTISPVVPVQSHAAPVSGSLGRQAGASGASASGAAASASSIVAIGGSPATDLTYAVPQIRVLQEAWATKARDGVSWQMGYNIMAGAGDAAGRLKGLGAALLKDYTGAAGDYHQTVLRFYGVRGSEESAQAQEVAGLELKAAPAQKIALTLKTQSGATVELSIASGASGLGVELKTSQALSDKELKAVRNLADGFEAAIKGLTERLPRIDIDGLSRFDSEAITSLDLTANFSKEGGDPLSLTFSATAVGRKLNVKTEAGAIDLNVDLSNPQIRGDQAQRDKVLSNYLSQVDVAAKRGNGDQTLISLFKNAFGQMHSYYPDASGQLAPRVLRDYEAAALSGLADFTANVKAAAVSSNPMRLEEKDTFEYRTRQESTLTAGDRSKLTQLQEATLDASFHKELRSDKTPMLTADPRSQNYRYFHVNDRISANVIIEHDELGLTRADREQSSSKLTHIKTYMGGGLTKQEEHPERHSAIVGLLDTLESLSSDPETRQRQLYAFNDRMLLKF